MIFLNVIFIKEDFVNNVSIYKKSVMRNNTCR
jgi:hypothetical protein